MLKIGMLGVSHSHADSYAAAVSAHSGAELVGVWDADAARSAAKAAEYGTKSCGDRLCAELIDAADAVIICSENVAHATLATQALAARRAVLCEKPLATTPGDARAMVVAAESAGVALFTAFPCRFSPAFQTLKSAAYRGDLGDILAVRGTNRGKCPGGWFVDIAASGGGAVMDHTVHVTDLLRVLLKSEVTSVFCEADNRMLPGDFDDTGIVTLTFESGAFATLDCSWSRPAKTFPTWGDVTLGVQGTKATVEMDMFAQSVTIYSETKANIAQAGYGSSIDGGLIAAFVHAVTTGDAGELATGTDGLRAVEVVAAAYESARTHKAVAVRSF